MDRDSLKEKTLMCIFLLSFVWGFFFIPVAMGGYSTTWTTTDGTILSSSVSINNDSSSNKYIPSIVYSYIINGIKYNGTRIAYDANSYLGRGFSKLDLAKQIVDKYENNSQVIVHVSPYNPTESVLEPGIKEDIGQFFAFFSFLTFLSVLFYTYLEIPDIKPFFERRKFINTVKTTNKVNFAELEKLSPNANFTIYAPKRFQPKIELKNTYFEKLSLFKAKIKNFTYSWDIVFIISIFPVILYIGSLYIYYNYIVFIDKSIFEFINKNWLIIGLLIYHLMFFIYLFLIDKEFRKAKPSDKKELFLVQYVAFLFLFPIFFGVILFSLLGVFLLPILLIFWFSISLIFLIPLTVIYYLLTGLTFNGGILVISLILGLITISIISYSQDNFNRIFKSLRRGDNYSKIYFNNDKPVYSLYNDYPNFISVSGVNKVLLFDNDNNNVNIFKLKHSGAITSVIKNSDLLLTASIDKQILVHKWSKFTIGQSNPIVFNHDAGVLSQFLFDDGSTIASGDQDGYLSIWSLKENKLLKRIKAHKKGIVSIKDYHESIITASLDGLIKIWNKQPPNDLLDISYIHSEMITTIEINNSLVVSGSLDKTLGILRIKANRFEEFQKPIELDSPIHAMVFYQDKFLFLGLRNGDLICIDITNNFKTAKKWSVSPLGIESLTIMDNSLISGSLLGIIKVHVIGKDLDITVDEQGDLLKEWLDIIELSQQSSCQICWKPITEQAEAKKCPHCGSNFHTDHLKSWFRQKKNCPLCLHQFAHDK